MSVEIVRQAVARHGGASLADAGEHGSTAAAFARPSDAVAAAFEAQCALAAAAASDGTRPCVRIALHTEEAEPRDTSSYAHASLARADRLRARTPGGQVWLSSATAAVMGARLPRGASLLELDAGHPARSPRSERVSVLCHPDLPRPGLGAPPGRPPDGWESLTPRERRVTELIAQGLPNRGIAIALFVSVSTVKTHLLHVFAKLEVHTRADLAAKAARRGG